MVKNLTARNDHLRKFEMIFLGNLLHKGAIQLPSRQTRDFSSLFWLVGRLLCQSQTALKAKRKRYIEKCSKTSITV